ncbi:MAG: hypothetical protein ABIA04_16310 [Pseudomonadota bacterium]
MKNKIVLLYFFITSALFAQVNPGDYFPVTNFDLFSGNAKEYLNINETSKIDINTLNAEIIIFEILSVYCTSCQGQAKYDKELYEKIENSKELKGKVKFIALAAGNSLIEIENFKTKFSSPLFILADPDFENYNIIAKTRTPFKIYLKKEGQKYKVFKTELGLRKDVLEKIKYLKKLLKGSIKAHGKTDKKAFKTSEISEDIIKNIIQDWVKNNFNGQTQVIEKVLSNDEEDVYKVKVDSQKYFGIVVNSVPQCDVCHDIQFVYIIDENGIVKDILPIQLTKMNNANLTNKEINQLKKSLVSVDINKAIAFDSKVDSISQATITVKSIFDSINKGKSIYLKLKKEGYLK